MSGLICQTLLAFRFTPFVLLSAGMVGARAALCYHATCFSPEENPPNDIRSFIPMKIRGFFAGALILAALAAAAFNTWVLVKMNKERIQTLIEEGDHLCWARRVIHAFGVVPRNVARENLQTTRMPVFDLEIKSGDMKALRESIPDLRQDVLVMLNKSEVKGLLRVGGAEYKVKASLGWFDADDYARQTSGDIGER